MGAICCLEKAGLPLHQGSSQNDGRRVQTFAKVLKKEEVGRIRILEVQEGSFYKQKFKCALKRTACLYKNQHLTDFRDRRGGLRIRRGQFKRSKRRAQNSKRPIQKIEEASSEITGNLSKRRSQISKRRQSFSASSTPVTCTLSLAEITDNLLKISDKEQST
ncbi:hypothetical protein ACFX12_013471 [Malus domestica]